MLDSENERSLITIKSKNKKGVVAKVATYCANNDMNIEKLVMSNFKSDNLEQKIVLYISGDRRRVNSLLEGLKNIEEVISIKNFQTNDYLERELVLIKINIDDPSMPRITDLVNEYQGQTILARDKIMIFQVTNDEEKNNELTSRLEKLSDNIEILKSGMVATSLDGIDTK